MPFDSVQTLVEALRHERLLEEEHFAQLTPEVLARFDTPEALAKNLVQLGWLTVYQVNHLFEGHAQELVIGDYCILDRLGEGGVSEVYKAWDTLKGRLVALKVMRQHLVSAADAVRQFEREREAVTRLSHPNVVKTYDAGQHKDTYYFAMEFVEGTDLAKVVQHSGPLPVGEACEYVRQVAGGLQHAHAQGLVHRDVKPANLYLIRPPGYDAPVPGIAWKRPPDPVIKVLDWGLARLQKETGEGEPSGSCGLGREQGMLIGTADYIAPEQATDPQLVDIRADIYSLGCTFFYLLTGRPPFPGTSLAQKLTQHQESEPPSVKELRPETPDEVAEIVRKMLSKQPESRYQIPLAVAVPLRRFCEVKPISDSPNGMAPANGKKPGTPSQPFGQFRRNP